MTHRGGLPRTRHPLATAFLGLALILAPLSSAFAWWNDDWKYRKEIVVDLRDVAAGESGARFQDVNVPIGLHSGNFPYFLMMAADGADLRVIAEDDETPLEFHIENIDIIAGLARLWVKLPVLEAGRSRVSFWLYYGNEDVAANEQVAQDWDEATVLAYHFAELEGVPRDATGYARDAIASTATPGVPGVVGSGLGIAPGSVLTLPATLGTVAGEGEGLSLSFWVRPDGAASDGVVGHWPGAFTLRLGALVPELILADGTSVQATDALVPERWQHLALTLSPAGSRIVVDGNTVAEGPPLDPATLSADTPLVFGSEAVPPEEDAPATGSAATRAEVAATFSMDELRVATTVRSPGWFDLTRALQQPGSPAVTFGADQSARSRGGSRFMALLRPLIANINAIGWAVIGTLAVLALLAWDAMIGKLLLLNRQSRGDERFLHAVSDAGGDMFAPAQGDAQRAHHLHSPMLRLAQAAQEELQQLPVWEGAVPAAYVNAVRSALDAQIVDETNRVNSKMVWITIAVSGGPFLGLLGTVIGVMLTFAAIAQSGDMNIATIAPGVAAALMTTIMGLLVAIPALFGYNYLGGRITRQLARLEVFADRLLNRVAVLDAAERPVAKAESERHAA